MLTDGAFPSSYPDKGNYYYPTVTDSNYEYGLHFDSEYSYYTFYFDPNIIPPGNYQLFLLIDYSNIESDFYVETEFLPDGYVTLFPNTHKLTKQRDLPEAFLPLTFSIGNPKFTLTYSNEPDQIVLE